MLIVEGADSPEQALDIIEIRHRSELEVMEEVIQKRIAAREAELRRELGAQCTAQLEDKDSEIARLSGQLDTVEEEQSRLQGAMAVSTTGREHHVLNEVLRARNELPPREVIDDGRDIVVRGLTWQVIGNLHVLILELQNNKPLGFNIGNLQLFDGAIDRTGEVQIDGSDQLPDSGAAPAVQGIIPAGGLVRAAMTVRNPQAVGNHLTLSIRDSDGKQPPYLEPIPTFRFSEPKDENEGVKTLYVKGMIGALRLAEYMDESMSVGSKSAFLSGYGARLTYGFTKHVNVETELVYAKSGTVGFGDVERSASLMRLQFGGLLRFGETYMPTLRLGVGLYGASQRRVMGGVAERKTDFDLSFTGGVGMDIRLSDAWVLGGALSLDSSLNSGSRSLELGLHLGYGWRQ